MRTPLTTIRLAADMLNDRRDDFDPATARSAERCTRRCSASSSLLTDLLEISRYDAGSVELELEPTSLAHLAEDVISSMSQLAEQDGSDVRLVAPGGYSPVEMDPRRIRRIVRNLLGNAIEHGEGRPIVVTVDSNQQAVALAVRDYGMGMTEADAERVFDRFWRADPSRKRTIGGTGLGLSIALGDATLHRGTLSVWSSWAAAPTSCSPCRAGRARSRAPRRSPSTRGTTAGRWTSSDSPSRSRCTTSTRPRRTPSGEVRHDPPAPAAHRDPGPADRRRARRLGVCRAARLGPRVRRAAPGPPPRRTSPSSRRSRRTAPRPSRSCRASSTPVSARTATGRSRSCIWRRRSRASGSRARTPRSTTARRASTPSPTTARSRSPSRSGPRSTPPAPTSRPRAGASPLKFSLDQVDGEWRISAAPNGIVLGADQFTSVFHQYPLMYFDPAWRYLVPDVRWFPSSNAATRVAQTLIDGKPSPWLSQSVVSAFPDNVSMNVPSVPIQGGVAQVELSGPLLALESATLDRMQTQLQRSLASVGGVTDVSMTYGGTPLEAQGVSTASTRIDTRALVRTDKGFGFIAAQDKIEPIPGITEAMSTINPVAVDLAPDYTVAAVRTRSGVVARVPSHGPIVSLDQRTGLINPTIDPRGYIWSVPRDSPDELLAYDSAGKAIEIAGGAWSNASQVTSMTLSRDGTRLAAILTVGGQPVVEVFGIVRDADGRPKSLGDATPVAKLPAAGIDLAWLDDSTLGVIAGSGASTVEIRQVVGGPGSSMSAPEGVTAISGTTGTTVRLLGRDGTLYAQRGSNWEQAGAGIRVLGDAQGMPAQG
ncbi:LpqB family beta-propeller domain-containing protein [Microbacterium elymi]|uniref:histidine kinase n=1 Tax=Microbacterium elymi TaxID=2909587 RepID=A0ABY5NKK7_9MICO|nr:LpqB family beta-propeller domain-containing protein [Microbacterium elymi]UUT35705.1 LpqB family beta-propeller domain-containing protein [Microbacterium elymi]